jgi:hypothetical protein
MSFRKPRWCVAEISKDGTINPISPSFQYAEDAEECQKELSVTEEYLGKNLYVVADPLRRSLSGPYTARRNAPRKSERNLASWELLNDVKTTCPKPMI